MRNILKFGFVVIFCTLCAINLWGQADTKKNLSVYFIYSNNATVSSSKESVKTLINDYLKYPGIKTYAVLAKSDSKLAKNLKSSLGLDGVIINDSRSSFKGVNLKSPQDILVLGEGNILLQHYTNFSQIVELLFSTGNIQGAETHKLSPKLFGDCSVVFPIDDEKNGTINLIIPEEGKMISLKNKPRKAMEVDLPSYFDSFYFFGNTIQSKIYRNEPFKNGHLAANKYYQTFDMYLKLIKNLTSGYGDTTGLYITTKSAALKIDSAVILFREIDQDKLTKLLKNDFYFSQNISLRVTADLNDSLMAAMLIKTPGNTNHLGLIDLDRNSMRIAKNLDEVMNSDSLIYIRFCGDKNNKMYMLNMKSNELKIINFKSPDKPIIKKYPDFIHNNLASKVLDIYTSDKILYILYFDPSNASALYLEEYKTDDFSFSRSYTLDINPDELELINIAGILDKSLYFFYKNTEGAWMLKSYKIL